MTRIDAWYLATQARLDMGAGMDSLLAPAIEVFGSAQPNSAYAFANRRATRMKVFLHDGFGLWLYLETSRSFGHATYVLNFAC